METHQNGNSNGFHDDDIKIIGIDEDDEDEEMDDSSSDDGVTFADICTDANTQFFKDSYTIPFVGMNRFIEKSNKAMHLKIVRKESDIANDKLTFHPEMTYQVFGNNEEIVGYQNLKVNLYYSAANLTTYIGINYSKMLDGSKPEDPNPDDVIAILGEKLDPGYLTDLDDFKKALKDDKDFTPPGNLIFEFSCDSQIKSKKRDFEVYYVDMKICPEAQGFHNRLQTFLLWYIEAANFIDPIEDNKWRIFFLFEKYTAENRTRYAIMGFITVYEFFGYPNNIRPRVSQVLILPPFQKMGLGTKLLEAVYQHYRETPQVFEITVESPSPEFQRVRDFVDCQACAKLRSFAPHRVKRGFTKEMMLEARTKLKINKRQALRVCNILRLKASNQHNIREMEHYMDALKKQIDQPFQNQLKRAMRKHLFEILDIKDIMDYMPKLNETYRQSILDQGSASMLEEYLEVIDRINRDK